MCSVLPVVFFNKLTYMKGEILSQCRCKRQQKHARYVLAKVFKIHTHSYLHNKSKCYPSSTHLLKCLGSDKFYTGQTDETKVKFKLFSLSTLWRYVGGEEEQLHSKTSTLDGCQWLTSHHSRFNPGKDPWYILYRMLGALPSQCGRFGKEKIL